MFAEENPRPLGIGGKLCYPQAQCVGALFGTLRLPHPPSGNRHQCIKTGPNYRVDAFRGCEAGFLEAVVPEPGAGIARAVTRAEPRGGADRGAETAEGNPGFFVLQVHKVHTSLIRVQANAAVLYAVKPMWLQSG